MFGVSTLNQKVQTNGQWLVAANIYRKALCFAFSDKNAEFQIYIGQILNLFAAQHENTHSKVIAYDKAVRTWVRGGTQKIHKSQRLNPQH